MPSGVAQLQRLKIRPNPKQALRICFIDLHICPPGGPGTTVDSNTNPINTSKYSQNLNGSANSEDDGNILTARPNDARNLAYTRTDTATPSWFSSSISYDPTDLQNARDSHPSTCSTAQREPPEQQKPSKQTNIRNLLKRFQQQFRRHGGTAVTKRRDVAKQRRHTGTQVLSVRPDLTTTTAQRRRFSNLQMTGAN
jgi:hypothetical protein